ncbi:MAG: hypothetical protein M1453_14075 [Acidobacteria bacterium]|nr:hypothetical protein [Acidobacteriota bacterium]MCL5289108.1 hypothetical protein [Acidobacteriota bacterium]
MTIRLRLKDDGSIDAIEVDSVEELLTIYQQFPLAGNRAGTHSFVPRKLSADTDNSPLPESAARLVSLLYSAPHGMNTFDVAKALHVDPKGVGGFVTSLTSWGRRRGLTKKQLIMKERRPNANGRMVRRINLTDFFRKMIEDGKVPGMKLET